MIEHIGLRRHDQRTALNPRSMPAHTIALEEIQPASRAAPKRALPKVRYCGEKK
jgi:hypothetical protein